MAQDQAIVDNLGRVQQELSVALNRAGRQPGEVRLCAVSKRHSVEAILAARSGGQGTFGESYAQELVRKSEALHEHRSALSWHFIGHLQRNKVSILLPHVDLIHGVDSERLARQIEKEAKKIDRTISVLLQVNTSGEESKFGCGPKEARGLAETIVELPHVELKGLMTLAARVENAEQARPMFRALARLRDEISRDLEISLPELSMGMSEDYHVAVEEGSTIVRIGTAIFGERPTFSGT